MSIRVERRRGMKAVRNKLLILVLLCALFFDISNNVYASESKTMINGNQDKGNQLLWSDEFNEEKINDNYWNVLGKKDMDYGYGSTLPFWLYDSNLCQAKDGCLAIKTQILWDNNQNCVKRERNSVTSSKIISKNLIECKYGRIEIRAKLAKGQSIWSMCYLLGNSTNGWPYCGEIKFWDYLIDDNPQLFQTAVSKEFYSLRRDENAWKSKVENVTTQFHLYSVEWSENSIKCYVDNKLTGCYERSFHSNKEIDKAYEGWPFDSPFYFVMECRPKWIIDGDNGKKGWIKISESDDISIYEDSMDIDYIRIYSLNKEEQTAKSINKKPEKGKIKSVKRIRKNHILVKFKKLKNAKKYQIQYAVNKNFKKAKIKTTKKLMYTIKKISKNKTYYIRVRGVNGTKKGTWSKAKKIKSKK